MVKSLMNQKLKQDDDVRIQEKVETLWLFDTGGDVHVMAYIANNKSNIERRKCTRSGSHGRSAGQRFHWII